MFEISMYNSSMEIIISSDELKLMEKISFLGRMKWFILQRIYIFVGSGKSKGVQRSG